MNFLYFKIISVTLKSVYELFFLIANHSKALHRLVQRRQIKSLIKEQSSVVSL